MQLLSRQPEIAVCSDVVATRANRGYQGYIPRPRLSGDFSVALGHLVVVAKKFRDEGRGHLCDEILNGGVTGA
jgi:hypothetical protein